MYSLLLIGPTGTKPSKGGGTMASKAGDTPTTWYEEVIKKGELIEDYPVEGFTHRGSLRPDSLQ